MRLSGNFFSRYYLIDLKKLMQKLNDIHFVHYVHSTEHMSLTLLFYFFGKTDNCVLELPVSD